MYVLHAHPTWLVSGTLYIIWLHIAVCLSKMCTDSFDTHSCTLYANTNRCGRIWVVILHLIISFSFVHNLILTHSHTSHSCALSKLITNFILLYKVWIKNMVYILTKCFYVNMFNIWAFILIIVEFIRGASNDIMTNTM